MRLAGFKAALIPLVAGLALMPGSAFSADTVISDQILPRDTYFYLSVPNVEELKTQMTESSFGQLIQDPSMEDFKNEVKNAFGSEIEEGFAVVQQALGLSVQELAEIPSGEISLAFSATGNKMGAVLFLDFGDNESQVTGLLERATGALGGVDDLSREDTEFDGTAITLYKVNHQGGRSPTPLADEFGWFLKDGRLVASNSLALLESALSNWSGESSDSFVNNEIYGYMLDRCQTEPGAALSKFYFNPIGLFTKLVQTGSMGEAGLGAGMAMGFLPTLGLDQLKAMGGCSEAGSGEFEWVSTSLIYSDQPPAGAMRVFLLDKVEQAPPEWVKDNATAFMSVNWQVDEAYTAVESLVDMFQGAGAFDGIINKIAQDGPRLHIKDDIIDQLTGELMLVGSPGERTTFGGDQIMFALGVRDEAKVSDILARITSEPGYPGSSREFKGYTVYEIETPNPGQSVGFTVANGKLMIVMGTNLLEQTLRNDSDMRPLAESEEYQKVAAHFPSDSLAVTFSRPAEQYRSLYELLQGGNAAQSFPGMDEVFERIDFTTLPPFETISSYLKPVGGYWVGDDNGVLMRSYQLAN